MLNATDSPQPTSVSPSNVTGSGPAPQPSTSDTLVTPAPTTEAVASSSNQFSTGSAPSDASPGSAPAPSSDSKPPSTDPAAAVPPIAPVPMMSNTVLPPLSTGPAHPPTAFGSVKNDISDTTERDSSYATALASKVGGSEPTLMSFSPPSAVKSDVVQSAVPVAATITATTAGSTGGTGGSKTGPLKKKNGSKTAKLVGGILAVLVLVGGLGAGYYLQTQKQDLEEKAYDNFYGKTVSYSFCNTFSMEGKAEDELTACPMLTSDAAVRACPAQPTAVDPSKTNPISTYKLQRTFKNLRSEPIVITYSELSNWCDEPLGAVGGTSNCSIHCTENEKFHGGSENLTKTVPPGGSFVSLIERTSDSGDACGSFQVDWRIHTVKLEDGTVLFDRNDINGDLNALSGTRKTCAEDYKKIFGTSTSVIAWGMCQTNMTCKEAIKISGTVQCVNPADGKKYPINEGTVTVADKTYQVSGGAYTADGVTSGQMISSRLTLPASFVIDVDGKAVTINSATTKTQATNGCDPTFMNANCGGIIPERAQQCTANNNLDDSYEMCTLPTGAGTKSGFDFLVTNCVIPKETELACVSTSLTPETIVAGSTTQMTLTCKAVTGAQSYLLTYPSNTATQTPITKVVPAPTTGNVTQTFSLNAVPAGTYNASCVPCSGTDGQGCTAPTAAACKDTVTVTKGASGVAQCDSKVAYTLNAQGAKVAISGGTTTTPGGSVIPGQQFTYDITVSATEQTTGEVTIVDTLPAKLEFVSAALDSGTPVTTPSSSSFFRSNSAGKLTFVLPAFGTGGTTTKPIVKLITLKVKVGATATPGEISNTVSVTTAGSTSSASTCTHKAIIPPDGVASCISKEVYAVNGSTVGAKLASNATVQAGTTLQYRVNLSAAAMTGGSVTVTDTLPSNIELVDKLDFDYNTSTRVLSKTLAAFSGDKALNARVRVSTTAPAGTITNTANVKTALTSGQATEFGGSCSVAIVVPAYGCNTSCTTTEQCQASNADYVCSSSNNNRCRLKDNESSETCQPKTFACNSSCSTDAECQSVNGNYSCVSTTDGNRCRLTSNQTATNCQTATTTPTPTPAVGCNQKCVNNADCSNPDHVCHSTGSESVCRLAADVNSTTCSVSTPIAEVQPAPPVELPQSGPENWSNWLKSGLVVIGIGAMLLLLI